MFSITSRSISQLNVKVSGRLNSEMVETALKEFENESKNIEKGKILSEVIDFEMPSLKVIGIAPSLLPVIFKLMKKFNQVAVLTNNESLKNKLYRFNKVVSPSLEIKIFKSDQKKEATSWLSQ
ncbi:MAG: STAS/SEC14 domain-containing protein [Methylococcales bacterium]|nr:STAS/SEC14 domain-containing protein [Methylococcales bacterium]